MEDYEGLVGLVEVSIADDRIDVVGAINRAEPPV